MRAPRSLRISSENWMTATRALPLWCAYWVRAAASSPPTQHCSGRLPNKVKGDKEVGNDGEPRQTYREKRRWGGGVCGGGRFLQSRLNVFLFARAAGTLLQSLKSSEVHTPSLSHAHLPFLCNRKGAPCLTTLTPSQALEDAATPPPPPPSSTRCPHQCHHHGLHTSLPSRSTSVS